MKNYSCSQIENLINRYVDKGGEIITIEEGCLGYGTIICTGKKLKTAIIQEVFVNAWNSTHTVRLYNKIPKNWQTKINKIN